MTASEGSEFLDLRTLTMLEDPRAAPDDWGGAVAAAFAAGKEAQRARPDEVDGMAHVAILREPTGPWPAWLTRHRLVAVSAFRPPQAFLEVVARLPELRVLELDHVRKADIAALRRATRVRAFTARWIQRATDLSFLQDLPDLQVLHLLDVTRLRLDTLPALPRLRILSLTAGGHGTTAVRVESLAPLSTQSSLEELRLLDIVPADGSLQPLRALRKLRCVTLSDRRFTQAECAGLAGALPGARGDALVPFTGAPVGIALDLEALRRGHAECGDAAVNLDTSFGHCARCGGRLVTTTGKPVRSLCMECDFSRLARHVEAWEAAKSAATASGPRRRPRG